MATLRWDTADWRQLALSPGTTPSLLFNNLSVNADTVAYAHKSSVLVFPVEEVETGSPTISKLPYTDTDMVMHVQWVPTKTGDVLVVTTDKSIQVWGSDLKTVHISLPLDSALGAREAEANYCRGAAGLVDVGRICVGCTSGDVISLDARDVTAVSLVSATSAHKSAVSAVSSFGDRLVTGDDTGEVATWDADSMTRTGVFEGRGHPCTSLASRRSYVVGAFTSGHIRIFSISSGSVAVEIAAHSRSINALTMHPSDDVFAAVGEDALLSVWGLPEHESSGDFNVELIGNQKIPDHLFTGIAFLPGKANILCCSYDTTVMPLIPSS